MKIAIIWPAHPYRWGIAQGVNSFILTLVKKGHDVALFNFYKQYPKWFFPGKNQFESSSTPDPFQNLQSFQQERTLNTVDPISWYKTYSRVLVGGPDICFIRYWHPFFVPCLYFICFSLRRRGIKVICIVDNLLPHERHIADILLVKILLSQVDKVITQSDFVHNQFSHFFPRMEEKFIPLPVYDQFWNPVDKVSARKYLKIPLDKNVLLFFGFIRPYKWLDTLLKSLPRVIDFIPDVNLYIVWECFGDFSPYQSIIDNLNLNHSIHQYLSYIPNEDVRYWLGSCDLLVMPYKSVTNSAVNSAWLYYSKKSLLTVGLSHEELSERIIYELVNSDTIQAKPITWDEFVTSAINFI